MGMRRNTEADIWRRVDKSGGPTACWPWTGGRHDKEGYGSVGWQTKSMLTHVLAFTLANGRPPTGSVCHTCDNPPCCNPLHLYDGTPATNARDRMARGRNGTRPRGAAHSRATLTEADVQRIRQLRLDGLTYPGIARATGCTVRQAGSICGGTSWAWLHFTPPHR